MLWHGVKPRSAEFLMCHTNFILSPCNTPKSTLSKSFFHIKRYTSGRYCKIQAYCMIGNFFKVIFNSILYFPVFIILIIVGYVVYAQYSAKNPSLQLMSERLNKQLPMKNEASQMIAEKTYIKSGVFMTKMKYYNVAIPYQFSPDKILKERLKICGAKSTKDFFARFDVPLGFEYVNRNGDHMGKVIVSKKFCNSIVYQ
jgi:uncharacterized membrane protein